MAQDTWPSLLAACSTLKERQEEYECLIQVPFEQTGQDQELREHLWLSLVSVKGDSADAVLVHDPHVVQGIAAGWKTTVTADEISGWILDGPHGRATPMDMEALHPLLPDGEESS